LGKKKALSTIAKGPKGGVIVSLLLSCRKHP
jgi:hypothetical protein